MQFAVDMPHRCPVCDERMLGMVDAPTGPERRCLECLRTLPASIVAPGNVVAPEPKNSSQCVRWAGAISTPARDDQHFGADQLKENF